MSGHLVYQWITRWNFPPGYVTQSFCIVQCREAAGGGGWCGPGENETGEDKSGGVGGDKGEGGGWLAHSSVPLCLSVTTGSLQTGRRMNVLHR